MFEEVHSILKKEPALKKITGKTTVARTQNESLEAEVDSSRSYRSYTLRNAKVATISGLPKEPFNEEQLEATIDGVLQREYRGAFQAKVPPGQGVVKLYYHAGTAEEKARELLAKHEALLEVINRIKSA